jgi:hypothetical protein
MKRDGPSADAYDCANGIILPIRVLDHQHTIALLVLHDIDGSIAA